MTRNIFRPHHQPMENTHKAISLKNQGNDRLKENDYDGAIESYSQAIDLDPSQAVFYSNRAQAEIKNEQYGAAIDDASVSIKLDPNYIKGYYRRSVAYTAIFKYQEAQQDLKLVLKKHPGDRTAKQYQLQVTKILKQQAFERAIQAEDAPSAISGLDFRLMIVEKHDLPQLEIEVVATDKKTKEQEIAVTGIDQSFVDTMIEHFKNGGKLPKRHAYAIVVAANQLFKKDPTMVEISLPGNKKNAKTADKDLVVLDAEKLTVCGDTHGQFFDLLNIFKSYGHVSKQHAYLFNGDFVDRGSWSTEIAFLLYALKIVYPDRLYINRGNHETNDMNKVYGFEGECKAKYSEKLYHVFGESFGSLPMATLIGNDWLVMHGGLFSDDNIGVADIKALGRLGASQPAKEGIAMELLWTDPQVAPGRSASKRGIGMQFGPDVTERFCLQNDLSGIIRSHEVRHEGYEKEHNGRLITVFSAPNYCDASGNLGAVIDFTVTDGQFHLEFHQFKEVPHPDIKPMAYANNFGY